MTAINVTQFSMTISFKTDFCGADCVLRRYKPYSWHVLINKKRNEATFFLGRGVLNWSELAVSMT